MIFLILAQLDSANASDLSQSSTCIWRIVTGNRFLPVIALRTCESGLSLIFGRSRWQ
jgi:hypothetical protein